MARAQQYLLLDGADTGMLMNRLNELAVARENELVRLREQGCLLAEQKARLRVEFERDKTALLLDLKKQAQDVLRQMREEKMSRRQALRELGATRRKLEANGQRPEPEAQANWEDFQVGGSVAYPAWGKTGKILERDERRKALKVELGGVSLWLPFQDLDKDHGQGAIPQPGAVRFPEKQPTAFRLDLRGQRAEEALRQLGVFLDRAILSGLSQVEIIHGRGTGALRREVQQFLKDFPAVSSFALANEDEGGDGVTQARLR